MLLAMFIGTALMLGVMLIVRGEYNIPVWKTVVIAITLAFAGYAGAVLMYFFESHSWDGRSFFGALFLAPLIMIPVAYFLKLSPRNVLDLCAPSECIMLMLLKIKCQIDGCCYGMVIGRYDSGGVIRFPSQIVEAVVALIMVTVIIVLIKRGIIRDVAYPWYMVIYGVCRFILNLLRETSPFVWIIPAGNFWALISLIIGLIWIFSYKARNTNNNKSTHSLRTV